MAKKKEVTESEAKPTPTFTKQQFVKSHRFAKNRDVLNALLDESTEYTIEDVEKILNDFFKPKKTK